MNLPELLRTELAARSWTMSDFARISGLSKQAVSQWLADDESDRPSPSTASCEKIAETLGLDLDYVLTAAGHRKDRGERYRDPRLAGLLADVEAGWEALDEPERDVAARVTRSAFAVPPFRRTPNRRQDGTANRLRQRADEASKETNPGSGGMSTVCHTDLERRPRVRSGLLAAFALG